MMRVGWLADRPNYLGGAELTAREFRAAAPDGVEIVDCPPGAVIGGLDRYVIHNCIQYTPEDLENIDAPAVKYWHDVGPHVRRDTREWLDTHAVAVCCSPVQAEYMNLTAVCVPPPVDLDRFREAGAQSNGNRAGMVSVGQWRSPTKAPGRALEYANGDSIDFYGGGVCAPPSSREVPYDRMPELLAAYRTFVFLPTVIEPFGRLVAEAWAAGCEVVTNQLVGARWWIENHPEQLDTAAGDFWKLVTDE